MQLDAIHHITCITNNGPRNVEFYVSVIGLRLVKKTINFDVTNAYHLYFGDESGNPGSILTFFEYPNAMPGNAGAGQIHRILWRVSDARALDFWTSRLNEFGISSDRDDERLFFNDPEGLGLGIVLDRTGDDPLVAEADDIPHQHRVLGFDGVRIYAADTAATEELLMKTLGFLPEGEDKFALEGPRRRATIALDAPPNEPAFEGAGSVHHIAWACEPDDHLVWREQTIEAGMDVTKVYDRKYFRSIYFREPSGVLFEIATRGPGFTVDEPLEELGETLSLPEWEEYRRIELEFNLTPIRNPRASG